MSRIALLYSFAQRRRFGGPRRPGERYSIGGGHGHYPLDYDYYETGDDQNLVFYGQQNNIGINIRQTRIFRS